MTCDPRINYQNPGSGSGSASASASASADSNAPHLPFRFFLVKREPVLA